MLPNSIRQQKEAKRNETKKKKQGQFTKINQEYSQNEQKTSSLSFSLMKAIKVEKKQPNSKNNLSVQKATRQYQNIFPNALLVQNMWAETKKHFILAFMSFFGGFI